MLRILQIFNSSISEHGQNKNLDLIQLIDNGEVKYDNVTKPIILFIVISSRKSTIRICKIIYLSRYNKKFGMS